MAAEEKKDSKQHERLKTTELGKYEKEMLTCTTCGFCKSVCPSFRESGWETKSPRARVLLSYGLLQGEIPPDESVVEALTKCTTCADCVRKCPSKVKLMDIIECARKELYNAGHSPEAYKRIVESITKYNNPYGEPISVAETLEEEVKQAEIGFFLGCTSAYRHPEIARAKRDILRKLGLNWTLVDSVCCGSPLKRTGGGGDLFERQVAENIRRIKSLGIKTLVISCAGCYKTFKHDYPKMDLEIVHLTEFLNRQKLHLKPLKSKITYHDPCHLGRGTDVYDTPRELLKKIPEVELIEMEHNRAEAWCCGGGGGVRAAYPDLSYDMGKKRLQEAKRTGAEILVTACPFCVDNLQRVENAEKTGIKIIDIINLIAKQMEWVSVRGLWQK